MLDTDVTIQALALLVLAAGLAGWVDAVVGGGGLIQLPSLILALPDDTSTAHVLGTNKMSSAAGTFVASLTYLRSISVDRFVLVPLVATAFVGSAAGSSVARFIPKEWLSPIVLVALIVVGAYTVAKPRMGIDHAPHPDAVTSAVRAGGVGTVVGLWDGLLGPGTGSFFVILIVATLGYGFLNASALAKLANLTTNVASLLVFGIHGEVLIVVGAAMATANVLGGFVGARTAIAAGNAFVRVVFLVVIAALIVSLLVDMAT